MIFKSITNRPIEPPLFESSYSPFLVKPVGGPKRRAWKTGGVCKQLLDNDSVLAVAAELRDYVDDLPAGIQFSLLNE